jgi:hypothetical protein
MKIILIDKEKVFIDENKMPAYKVDDGRIVNFYAICSDPAYSEKDARNSFEHVTNKIYREEQINTRLYLRVPTIFKNNETIYCYAILAQYLDNAHTIKNNTSKNSKSDEQSDIWQSGADNAVHLN